MVCNFLYKFTSLTKLMLVVVSVDYLDLNLSPIPELVKGSVVSDNSFETPGPRNYGLV
jgi:hypothetical protein